VEHEQIEAKASKEEGHRLGLGVVVAPVVEARLETAGRAQRGGDLGDLGLLGLHGPVIAVLRLLVNAEPFWGGLPGAGLV
jgi:hypothetical protein